MFLSNKEPSACSTSVSKIHHSVATMLGRPHVHSTKPAQEGFRRVSSTGEPSPCPVPGFGPGVLEMRVKEGSKIRNLLGFAMSRLQGGHVNPVSQVMFSGIGRAITKTITCAEILKRNVLGLHQVSKLQYKTVREVWQSQVDESIQMTVLKNVPAIYILLSKEPLDPLELGYQSPVETSSSTEEKICGEVSRKRPLTPFSFHESLPDYKRSAWEHTDTAFNN